MTVGPEPDRAPDGGPNNQLDDPYVRLLGQLADLGEQVDLVAGQVAAGDLPSLVANVEQLRDTLADHQDRWAGLTHPQGESGTDDPGGLLVELQEQVKTLAEDVGTLLAADEEPKYPIICWVELNAEQAEIEWQALRTWIAGVLLTRYPIDDSMLRPCWYRHPAAVEELSWLHVTWCRAYRLTTAPAERAAEWHDRWLPGVRRRLREEWVTCKQTHEPYNETGNHSVVDDNDAFTVYVQADVDQRKKTPAILP